MASDDSSQDSSQVLPRNVWAVFYLGQSFLIGGVFSLILFEIIPSTEFLLRLSFGPVPSGRVGFWGILLILGVLGGILLATLLKVFEPIFRATKSDNSRILERERRWPLVFVGTLLVIGLLYESKTMFGWNGSFKYLIYGTMVIGVLLQLGARFKANRTS